MTVTAYKAFNADWTCRGYQYAVGETFRHEGPVEICGSGFHACLHPLDCFDYYAPGGSRFALVEYPDVADAKESDTKVCGAEITIKVELTLGEMIEAAVKAVFDAAKWTKAAVAKASREGATATGDSGAASATGDNGAANATGGRGAASATGNRGAASATGNSGAASATGDSGAASATGDSGAASATGNSGAAMASGWNGKAMGAEGCALFLCDRDDDDNILHVWAGIAGRDGIEPLTWYSLQDGKPTPVGEDDT